MLSYMLFLSALYKIKLNLRKQILFDEDKGWRQRQNVFLWINLHRLIIHHNTSNVC